MPRSRARLERGFAVRLAVRLATVVQIIEGSTASVVLGSDEASRLLLTMWSLLSYQPTLVKGSSLTFLHRSSSGNDNSSHAFSKTHSRQRPKLYSMILSLERRLEFMLHFFRCQLRGVTLTG
jgi:hypothetical protein